VCNTAAATLKADTAVLLEYVLENLSWALRYEQVAPKQVTQEWLDKARSGEAAGFIHLSLCRRQLIRLLNTWAEDLEGRSGTATEVAKWIKLALLHFKSYLAYESAFAPASGAPARLRDDPDALQEKLAGSEDKSDDDPLDVLKLAVTNKTAQAVMDFAYDVLSSTYDKVFAEELKTTALKDIAWPEV